jgi:hypothetical protein
MDTTLCYTPAALNNINEKISQRHKKQYELTRNPGECKALLGKLAHMEVASDLWAELKGYEVDELFYSLNQIDDVILLEKIFNILKQRVNKRHLKIVWGLLQHDWKNSSHLAAGKLVYTYMMQNCPEEYDKSLIQKFTSEDIDLMECVYQMLNGYTDSLDSFVEHWSIVKFAPFYWELSNKYLSHCKADKLQKNIESIKELFSNMDFESLSGVLENYLSKLQVNEFNEELCQLIVQRFEKPDSSLWEGIAEEATANFEKWLGLRAIQSFFGKDSRSWEFWNKCRDAVLSVVEEQNTSSLYIYTERYVAFACQEHNYLIRKKVYRVLYEAYSFQKEQDDQVKFHDVVKNYITAREALLEGKISGVYKIDYENAGILYIREILEMSVADEYEAFNRFKQ